MITNGAMEAVHIALRCLTRPGDNVLIQSPCFFLLLPAPGGSGATGHRGSLLSRERSLPP